MSSLMFWPLTVGAISESSPQQTDPHFASVVQLAHFNGTNGSHTYTNSCPRGNTLISQVGNSSLSTTSPKWGSASLRMPSGSDQETRAASHADYNFGTGDWTVEFWVNPDTLTRNFNSAKVYFDMRNTALTAAWVPTIAADNDSGALRYIANGSIRITTANVMVAATWNYVAACRNSGVTRLFHGVAGGNATQAGSDFTDANTYVQNIMTVMAASNGGGAVIGYMDDLRVTKGVGRYTTTFAVPAGQFPNQ